MKWNNMKTCHVFLLLFPLFNPYVNLFEKIAVEFANSDLGVFPECISICIPSFCDFFCTHFCLKLVLFMCERFGLGNVDFEVAPVRVKILMTFVSTTTQQRYHALKPYLG